MVVFERSGKNDNEKIRRRKMNIKYSPKGILFAFIGAVGQAGGLVISKYGMAGYSVFGATQIRIIAASIGFALLVVLMNKYNILSTALQNRKTMIFITIGAIFGPFIGVYLSLLSVKFTSVGIASTIMAIVPILIIPPAIVFLKEKVSWIEVFGSVIAVMGVAIFFL
jgi:drug/metabolite transporter (DMT)-like permease